MEFFTQLFSQLNTEDSWTIIAFLFVAFLIGFITGWILFAGRLSKQKKAYNQLMAEHNALKAKQEELKQQLDLKEADLKKAHLDLENARVRSKRLEAEKGQLHGDLYAAREAIKQAEEAKSAALAQAEALDNQVLGLQTKLNAAGTGNSLELEQQLRALRADVEKAQAQAAEAASQSAALSADNDGLKAKIADLEAQLGQANSRQAALESERAALNQRLDATASALQSAEEKAAQAKEAVRAALGTSIVAASAAERDDLKRVNGIGPFIEEKLNALGIYTFEQIGQFDDAFVEVVTDAIQFFPGRIQRDNWVQQAKALHAAKTEQQ